METNLQLKCTESYRRDAVKMTKEMRLKYRGREANITDEIKCRC